jgi:hypothetical protein
MILAAAALLACAPEEIVVATLPEEDSGPSRPSRRCANNADCRPGDFCNKRSCDSVGGLCERRPIVCQPDANPVCGCDGVSYFNDCLRRSAGIGSGAPGECGDTARECADASSCPAGGHCAKLLGSRAECPGSQGVCWVLPAECPAFVAGDRWSSCAPPSEGGAPCMDTCRAIQHGHASSRTSHCLE